MFKVVATSPKEVKSTFLNYAVNRMMGKTVHPNNFRVSCRTLEEHGLIMRRKEELDWYVNITPEGFDLALGWIHGGES
nr:hypothetical protein [Vibrio azureus]